MSKKSAYNLARRPRRLRQSAGIRQMLTEVNVVAADLIQPIFVVDGNGEAEPINAMPGVHRLTLELLMKECEAVLEAGILSVALFPKLEASLKSEYGDEALNPDTLILRAAREIKKRFPELVIVSDIALDPYTLHGHDGILNTSGSDVDNDRTLDILAKMALLSAEAGVDFVAPSDMMDGRVGVIRSALDERDFIQTGILAYSAKFSSAYYGPFREAVGSSQQQPISKDTYQLNPSNRREAMVETILDEAEGADILMVKPAGPYLDVIREVTQRTQLPVAAYQVSGEYAQIHAAAQLGWLDYDRIRDESLLAIKRAGADLILSYFAREFAESR